MMVVLSGLSQSALAYAYNHRVFTAARSSGRLLACTILLLRVVTVAQCQEEDDAGCQCTVSQLYGPLSNHAVSRRAKQV